jgi:hypothetical protein
MSLPSRARAITSSPVTFSRLTNDPVDRLAAKHCGSPQSKPSSRRNRTSRRGPRQDRRGRSRSRQGDPCVRCGQATHSIRAAGVVKVPPLAALARGPPLHRRAGHQTVPTPCVLQRRATRSSGPTSSRASTCAQRSLPTPTLPRVPGWLRLESRIAVSPAVFLPLRLLDVQAQPSSFIAQPAFHIFVKCLIVASSNCMT